MRHPLVKRLARTLILLLALSGALIGMSGTWAATPARIDRTTPAGTADDGAVNLAGSVLFRPRYRTISTVPQPRAYLVLFDASRSMSWNFAGQGTRNGQTVQCGPTSDPNVQRIQCGSTAPWSVISERRIYVAKQALLAFIDRLHPDDMMRLIVFSTRQVAANIPWRRGDPSGKLALREAVLDAGNVNGDPYLTDGEVPTASALFLANQLMAKVPGPAPSGAAYGKPAVILLTGSVANSFLLSDGGWRYNDTSCGAPFPEDTAACQVGYTNDNPPQPKPINAMVLEADLVKQDATIYVIALAGVDETGLKDVASAPSYPFFSTSPTGAELPQIMADIQRQTTQGMCVPAGGAIWLDTFPPERAANIAPPLGPLVYPTVGYAYLRDQNGQRLPRGPNWAPIVADRATGRVSYRFDNLAPGVYRLSGFVVYKGDDGIARVYATLFDPNTQLGAPDMIFQLTRPGAPGNTVSMRVYLDLNGTVCP